MSEQVSIGPRAAIVAADPARIDSLAGYLSHKDRQVRQSAAVELGNSGSRRAVEPLVYAMTREFSRGSGSFPLIIDILDALAKVADPPALDVLIKVERQMIDRNSCQCPPELPAGAITYIDTADGQLHRAVPKELHFKIFDSIRRISARLSYRVEEVEGRYQAYQEEVIAAEIARTVPEMAKVLSETAQCQEMLAAEAAAARAEQELPAVDSTEDVDYEVIRREMEIEVAEYVRDNTKLQTLIRDGQRIKAHIQHAKLEKTKPGLPPSAPALSTPGGYSG